MASLPSTPVAHLLGSNGPVHALTYSASPGAYILTGSADRSIRLYNPSATTIPGTAHHNNNSSSNSNSITAPTSSAGATAAVPEARLIQTYAAHGYEVLSLTAGADNARFASAGGDRAVFLWDVATAQTIRRFGGGGGGGGGGGEGSHSARVNSVAFAGPEDSLLVSGSRDATVRVWDVRAGSHRPIQVLSEARDSVSCVAVVDAAASPAILAGSVDGRVRSYDIRTGRCVTDVVGGSSGGGRGGGGGGGGGGDGVEAAGDAAATAAGGGAGGAAAVTSLCPTRDGRAVLVSTLDGRVRLMDRETGACLRALGDPRRRANSALRVQALLGAGERLALAGDEMTAAGSGDDGDNGSTSAMLEAGDGRLWAWDVLTGEVRARLRVPWGPLSSAAPRRRRAVGRDGRDKGPAANVLSCLAWREGGFGDQFCVSGTSGVVTVYGYP